MKHLRAISAVTTAAVVGLGMSSGTATASVTACTTEPAFEASIVVSGTPVIDKEYSKGLTGGSYSAEWSSAWNLAVKYAKTSGTISGTFRWFYITTNEDSTGSIHQTCGWGTGSSTFTAQHTPTYIFTGSAQPPKPSNSGGTEEEIIAVMYIPSEGHYYGIDFTG